MVTCPTPTLSMAGAWPCLMVAALPSSERPADIVKPLEDQQAAPGEDVVLSCELSRAGTPVRWLRDGKAIRKSQKYDLIVDGPRAMLVVRAVSPKDSGEYMCETEASKSTASLRVEGDPTRHPGRGPCGLSRRAAHGGGCSLSEGLA